ncbi:MAG: hypothetical protein B6D79_01080 [gamma proteobacterium symbiont of Ctena orbiculata]|nr:MAG: hypothetical protein B6D79_01080 [gamma proteobacterium symbiont of Ctena orbiculata]
MRMRVWREAITAGPTAQGVLDDHETVIVRLIKQAQTQQKAVVWSCMIDPILKVIHLACLHKALIKLVTEKKHLKHPSHIVDPWTRSAKDWPNLAFNYAIVNSYFCTAVDYSANILYQKFAILK